MPIHPLPQFEADLKEFEDERDREVYERLKPPDTIVVRFGSMKMIGEFKYDGDAKPGCGSKIVVRTFRGTEIGEMLTSTCPNAGCSKSVTRNEMLDYIEASGGRKYPFSRNGRALRVATREDMDAQARLEQSKNAMKLDARRRAESLRLDAKVVEVEPILGGERITLYYTSEASPDMGPLQKQLAEAHQTNVEVKQVGARDEARLTADYERCGQYCCCKNFLKVLKPVSMRSAKTQKATLDPLKISGRCGRLMCCLRYEDETYESLKKRLPKRKKHVGTPDGDGTVIDTQILTQLVLVKLDGTGAQVAVPVEEITEPTGKTAEASSARPRPGSGSRAGSDEGGRDRGPHVGGRDRAARRDDQSDSGRESPATSDESEEPAQPAASSSPSPTKKKRKRRRRKKPSAGDGSAGQDSRDRAPEDGDHSGGQSTGSAQRPDTRDSEDSDQESADRGGQQSSGSGSSGRKKKRRRRRRRRNDGSQNSGGGPGGSDSPADDSGSGGGGTD